MERNVSRDKTKLLETAYGGQHTSSNGDLASCTMMTFEPASRSVTRFGKELSTGQYSTLADWGGWQTTVRVDGVHDLDFALLSLREIIPPQ